MGYKITSPAATEPVSVAELKAQLFIDGNDEDDLLLRLIKAATTAAEQITGRALITQTIEESFDCFPDNLTLSLAPVQSVSSISYLDENGDSQTLVVADYVVDAVSVPTRICLAPDKNWPLIQNTVNAVKVTYIAGYGDASAVPADIKQAILMKAGKMYCAREDVKSTMADASDILLSIYRVWRFE